MALLVGGSAFGLLQAEPAKALFNLNCASCHGEDGRGQTAVGKALKARNFLTEDFKQGDSLEAIKTTLEKGVPGTAMVGYSYLKKEDRASLAQYVRALRTAGGATSTKAPVTVEKAVAEVVVEQKVSKPAPVVAAEQKVSKPAPVVETKAPEPVEVVEQKIVAAVKTVAEVIPVNPEKVKGVGAKAKATEGGEDPKITLGRKAYKMQGCNSCHGDNGQADTPTGMALKARNFVIGDYKLGGDKAGIKKALAEGVPGTAMIAYPQIKGEELDSLATFIMALKGNPEIADDPDPSTASGSGKVSISYAMELVAEHERTALNVKFDKSSKGAAVYATSCAECHGDNGQGGVSVRMISSAPYYRVKTMPVLGHDGDWMKRANFDKLITKGLPGRMMPGLGTISKADLDDLYNFFVESKKAVK